MGFNRFERIGLHFCRVLLECLHLINYGMTRLIYVGIWKIILTIFKFYMIE
jgi:hypothetical protein